MFLFRKFLLLFILIGALTPFAVFGMCSQAFSEFIIEIKLPERLRSTLYNKNIHTIEDLTSKTAEELMRLDLFTGGKFLRKIEAGLAKKGMSLASFPYGPLNLLNISSHTKASLHYAGIHTIEALVLKTPVELMERFNNGRISYYARRKMLNEVKAVLAERGLSLATATLSPLTSVNTLGFSYNIKNIFRFTRIYTVEDLTSKTVEDIMKLPDFGREYLKQVQEILADGGLQLAPHSDPSSVNSLGFSIHVRNALSNAEIYTIEALTSKTPVELINSGYFRRRSLKEVKTVLAERGLKLASVPFDPTVSVNRLGVSSSIKDIFYRAGIRTIGELTSKTAEELMIGIPNPESRKLIEQIEVALAERDLRLASAPH